MPTWALILKDVILAIVAVWGATLGTITYRRTRQKDERSVLVRLSLHHRHDVRSDGEPVYVVEATNSGHRPVTISRFFVETSDEGMSYIPHGDVPWVSTTSLPVTLTDGQMARTSFYGAQLDKALLQAGHDLTVVTITPACEDTLGQVYRGSTWVVPTVGLLERSAASEGVRQDAR